jgi:NADH-quinone oxidoreductase subunit M
MPLLLMITCSISFGILPGRFYDVIRSGVDPLIARITHVAPLASEGRDTGDGKREANAASSEVVSRFPVTVSRGQP